MKQYGRPSWYQSDALTRTTGCNGAHVHLAKTSGKVVHLLAQLLLQWLEAVMRENPKPTVSVVS